MSFRLYGIIVASVILPVALFGPATLLKILVSSAVLVLGILTRIYGKYARNLENRVNSGRQNLDKKTDKLRRYIEELSRKKMTFSPDRRVTGSRIIDESLQEILDFVLRDYVEPWYNLLTDDDEFTRSVGDTARKIAINVANRVKEVDWIPYLTTRLVDDAASHMRLYRQARAKMKELRNTSDGRPHKGSSGGGGSSTSGGTPKPTPTHRRNKSETDVSWYSRSKFYIPNVGEGGTEQGSLETRDKRDNDTSLEKIFFDLEVQMENNSICRDLVCTNEEQELAFLGEMAEVLLYLLLPKEDFDCLTVRFILRELLVNVVIGPLLNLFSDPDYMNQAFIWLCTKETSLPSEVFLSVIRITDSLEELAATKNLVCREIGVLRSKDSGSEQQDLQQLKQQLKSLLYVKENIEVRMLALEKGLSKREADGIGDQQDWKRYLTSPNYKLVNLPLDQLLKNNIALSYLIDYMSRVNAEAYLFFYLNIYGWKVSAEQQISESENERSSLGNSSGSKRRNVSLDNLKEAALKIYQQYLSDRAAPKLSLDDGLVKELATRIKTQVVRESWFDELQARCYEKLESEDRFLPSFKRSFSYVKLLAELDLLKDPPSEDDLKSLDGISVSSISNDPVDTLDESFRFIDDKDREKRLAGVAAEANSSTSLTGTKETDIDRDETDAEACTITSRREGEIEEAASGSDRASEAKDSSPEGQRYVAKLEEASFASFDRDVVRKLQLARFEITAEIIETGVVNDRGKTYGIYAVAVQKNYDSGYHEKWHIYRRYSDFHDLHQKIKDKYYDLAKIAFPAKKAFHNMERAVLEKRMTMLNAWLRQLTKPGIVDGHMGLQNMLLAFLEQGDYDRGVTGGHVSRTIDTLVNPLKTSMKTVTQAVKTMPDNMLSTVDGVMDNISKFFGNPRKNSVFYESVKVGASLDAETDDNIPLRIILLLMDEVFDLKVRNQWLRRRIITLLRQIIRTMFGDIVNRRIVEYVSLLTSPDNVATYLRLFKQSHWPNGVRAETKAPRDRETKDRTRVAAKVALLSCLSDELKHIIGSETTRRGLLRVFELFQRPVLNRRLLYVLLEGITENLFPRTDLLTIIRKLYSVSPRIKLGSNANASCAR